MTGYLVIKKPTTRVERVKLHFMQYDATHLCTANGDCAGLSTVDFLRSRPFSASFFSVNGAELEQLFSFMVINNIPALEPQSLEMLTRLLRAGVRIVGPEEVQPHD